MGKTVTEQAIDAEMVRRGWARPLAGGFVGDDTVVKVRPVYGAGDRTTQYLDYVNRRERIRTELVNAAKGNKSANIAIAEAYAFDRFESGASKDKAARDAVEHMRLTYGQTVQFGTIRKALKGR